MSLSKHCKNLQVLILDIAYCEGAKVIPELYLTLVACTVSLWLIYLTTVCFFAARKSVMRTAISKRARRLDCRCAHVIDVSS